MKLSDLLSRCASDENCHIEFNRLGTIGDMRKTLSDEILNSEVTGIKTDGCSMLWITTSYRDKSESVGGVRARKETLK